MAGADIRVCFLGDSFTLGQGDIEGLGWPGRVHAAERGRGADLTLYNLGVRGQTAAEIAERAFPETGVRLLGRGERRGVVLSCGANDLFLGRPPAETTGAVDGLLRWATGQGYHVFVVGMPPAAEADVDALRAGLDKAVAAIASAHAAPFLDIRTAVGDWSAWHDEARRGDGVHPGAAGYAGVAAAFLDWRPWRRWLET
jgi:lysophospholipase L1-like esterase